MVINYFTNPNNSRSFSAFAANFAGLVFFSLVRLNSFHFTDGYSANSA